MIQELQKIDLIVAIAIFSTQLIGIISTIKENHFLNSISAQNIQYNMIIDLLLVGFAEFLTKFSLHNKCNHVRMS